MCRFTCTEQCLLDRFTHARGFFVTCVCSRMGFVWPFGLGFVILLHMHLKLRKAAKIIALRTEEELD